MLKRSALLIRRSWETKIFFSKAKPYSMDSFYNWDDPQSYKRVVKEKYFLKDVMKGFYRHKELNLEINEDTVTFLSYIYSLFPQKDKQILPDLVKSFEILEAKQQMRNKIPEYYRHLKNVNLRYKLLPFLTRMRERINDPKSFHSLDRMKENLNSFGIDNLGQLSPFFRQFKKKVFFQLQSKNYKLSDSEIVDIIEIHQNIKTYDLDLNKVPFLEHFPKTFIKNEETFQNLITFMIKLTTKNFLYLSNKHDFIRFQKSFEKCQNFKSLKTKALLRSYSEHLCIINFSNLVTFGNLLDKNMRMQ